MKRYLQKVLLFFLLAVLLSGASQLFYQQVVMRDSLSNRSDREFWASDRPYSTLVLGDSHLLNGVDTRVLPSTYNFSMQGENYIQSYYKLEYLLEHWTYADSLKRIILPVSVHSFSSFRSRRFFQAEVWRKYIPPSVYLEQNGWDEDYLKAYLVASLFSFNGRGEDVLGWLVSFVHERVRTELIHGFSVETHVFGNLSRQEQLRRAEQRAEMRFAGQNTIDETLLAYFNRIIDLCDQRGIRVVLVTAPVTQVYESVLWQEGYGTEKALGIAERTARRDANVTYVNDLSLFYGSPQWFKDPDHLNASGAERFSERLLKDLSERGSN